MFMPRHMNERGAAITRPWGPMDDGAARSAEFAGQGAIVELRGGPCSNPGVHLILHANHYTRDAQSEDQALGEAGGHTRLINVLAVDRRGSCWWSPNNWARAVRVAWLNGTSVSGYVDCAASSTRMSSHGMSSSAGPPELMVVVRTAPAPSTRSSSNTIRRSSYSWVSQCMLRMHTHAALL